MERVAASGEPLPDRAMIAWQLFRLKWNLIFRSWRHVNINAITRACSFLALLILFGGTTYYGVARLCRALAEQPVVGPILLTRVFSLGFLSVFVLSALSHIFTAYSSLFTNAELPILHAKPVNPETLFRVQVSEAIVRGTWMIGLICLPIVVAYGNALDAPPMYYLLVVCGIVPFLLIGGAIGVVVALLVARFFVSRPRRMQFLAMLLAGMGLALAWAGSPLLRKAFQAPSAAEFSQQLAEMSVSSDAYFPHVWLWELLDAGVDSRYGDAALYGVLLIGTAWVGFVVMAWIGDRCYMHGWLSVQDKGWRKRGPARRRIGVVHMATRLLPRWLSALFRRDAILFVRDAGQWTQFIILFCLVLIYLIHVYNVSSGPTNPEFKTIIALFNVVLMGFVQATLALRYAYPTIGAEGKAVWTVFKSPLSVERYLLAKLVQQLLWILLFGTGMTWLLNTLLDIPPPVSQLGLMVVMLLSFGFAACTVGLGAYFARFDTGNVTEISSGTGALVTAMVTLSYLAFSVAILARLILLPSVHSLQIADLVTPGQIHTLSSVAIFVLLQLAAVLYPLYLGTKALKRA